MHVPTKNQKLIDWVAEVAKLTTPANVVWCDGSKKEYSDLCEMMVAAGVFTKLNPKTRPGCYLARSHASDVARVEDRTFICSTSKDEAGGTNNWRDPEEMKVEMRALYKLSLIHI